jgi:hypothetical protein
MIRVVPPARAAGPFACRRRNAQRDLFIQTLGIAAVNCSFEIRASRSGVNEGQTPVRASELPNQHMRMTSGACK